MQEPILQDKRAEHLKFCEYGRSLIERASGRPMIADENFDMEKLYKVRCFIYYTKVLLEELSVLGQHCVADKNCLQPERTTTVIS